MAQEILLQKPKKLQRGDCIGIFTPSTPAYTINEGLFCNGIGNLERLGFRVKLGGLTQRRAADGYRSASPQERAAELMQLIVDPQVEALMSTIGGYNSSSLIPYLDFVQIRQQKKLLCGYSDVTSLHLAFLHYAGLQSLYGPALMTWIGEYPRGIPELEASFLQAVGGNLSYPRVLQPFGRWSNHFRNWSNNEWMQTQREWKENSGWRVLLPGQARAQIVVANLNTLCSAAGTPYFPALEGRILLLEEEDASWSIVERNLRQLQLIGVFEQIQGLIWSKPEKTNPQGSSLSLDSLLLEVAGGREYPIVANFDCGHTVPSHSIGLAQLVQLEATAPNGVDFQLLESLVSES